MKINKQKVTNISTKLISGFIAAEASAPVLLLHGMFGLDLGHSIYDNQIIPFVKQPEILNYVGSFGSSVMEYSLTALTASSFAAFAVIPTIATYKFVYGYFRGK